MTYSHQSPIEVTMSLRGEKKRGQGSVNIHNRYAQPHWMLGHTFVCPKCGEAWAQIAVPGYPFRAIERLCPDHGPGRLTPVFPSLEEWDLPTFSLEREVHNLANPSKELFS